MAKGHVYKRGKLWYVDYYTGRLIDGEYERIRRRAQGITKEDAKIELEEILYKLNRASRIGDAIDNRYPIQCAYEDWKAYLGISIANEKTRQEYLRNARNATVLLREMGIDNVSGVSHKILMDMLSGLVESLSNNSANKVLVQVKRMFDYAVKNKKILENPAVDLKKLPEKRVKFRRAFSFREVEGLLECATDTWRPFYYCAVSTGMREAEIVNLRWADVDLEASRINIALRSDWKPKTDAAIRHIPMTDKLKVVLKDLPRASEYVFCTKDGVRRSNNILRHFRGTVGRMLRLLYPDWDKQKISDEKSLLDFHALRYTFCTMLINKGVDVKTVQRIMGHANVQTTLGIYAQYCGGAARNAIGVLPW